MVDKEELVLLSSVTLQELEDIKTSGKKSEEVRYQARQAVRWLEENPLKYQVIMYDIAAIKEQTAMYHGLEDTNDIRILTCAAYAWKFCGYENLVFVSNDILARLIAKKYFELPAEPAVTAPAEMYLGYKEKVMSEEDMAYFYEHLTENTQDLLINEYLLLKNSDGDIVDKLKWTGEEYQSVRCKPFKSNMFGTLKPLDDIQAFAMDSINTNDITVLYGKAGSGKTTLPLNYIMQEIEKGRYRKCYVIYSFEPLKGAKTLGFEKGDHITKLIYSASIGNILASKFGDIQQVEFMIERGMIDIIPTANIRGVEFESDSICLCTEAQNLDVYTLKTIVQRCKAGCKQIYEGDIIEQKDTDVQDIGINRLIDVFKGHKSFGCVKLKNNYRSELSELADKM